MAQVVACFPPGHGELPTVQPTAAPDAAAAEHQKGLVSLQQLPGSAQAQRANAVRDAIRHAWSHYKQFAWGMDELLPVSGRGRNRGFNLATTMVDSLDTSPGRRPLSLAPGCGLRDCGMSSRRLASGSRGAQWPSSRGCWKPRPPTWPARSER